MDCLYNQECVLTDTDHEISFNRVYDIESEAFYPRLSVESSLVSMISNTQQMCYIGSQANACEIFKAMAGVDNRDYFLNGGHLQVKSVNCDNSKRKINLKVEFQTDYDESAEVTQRSIPEC